MFNSIRWTVQLWHAAILLLALTTFGTVLYQLVIHADRARVDSELEGAAHMLANGPDNGPNSFRGFGPGGQPGGPNAFDDGPGPNGRPFGRPFDGPDRGGPGMDGPGRGGPGMDGPGMGDPGMRGPDGDFARRGQEGQGPGGQQNSDWWARVPTDALRRIGQTEDDQPYFVIWNGNGRVIRSSRPATDISIPDSVFNSTGGKRPISPSLPGLEPDQPLVFRQRGDQREAYLTSHHGLIVLVGKSVVPEQRNRKYLAASLLGYGAIIMCVGLLGGWLLSYRVTRPIALISQTAQQISATDLSRRIPVEEARSELGSLARTLNETFARLDSAFSRQARFAADASHELRTPIAVIHSHAELALSRPRTVEEYRLTIETTLRAVRRMKGLVESLLVLARADAGTLPLKLQRFDLKELCEETLAMLEPHAAERHVELESDLATAVVNADRTRLAQLLTNLLNNGIRYNREQGTVTLGLTQADGQTVITVKDTGIGIELGDQPRIFERFFRADPSRSRDDGGAGLGLSIVQSIVAGHGGTVDFTSVPGSGDDLRRQASLAVN